MSSPPPALPPPAPTLGDAIARRLATARRLRVPRGWWRGLWGGAIGGLALAALFTTQAARRREAEAARLAPAVAQADRARADLAGFARAAARPSLDARLDEVGGHLPPGADPVALATDRVGRLTIDLATADPDALREARARDRWFAGWREQSQATGEDGRVRVTLAAPAQ